MMKRKMIFLFFMVFSFLSAQTRLEVRMAKTTMRVGEATRLDFVFNAVGDDFIPPKIVGFQVNGPMMSQSENVINGVYTGNQQFSYVIQAIKPGKFTIPSAMVEFRGRLFKSQPIVINVLNQNGRNDAVSGANDANSNKNYLGKNAPVFLEAEVSKSTAFINEPIEINYRVYLNPKFKIEKENKINFPKYNNFWSQTEDLRDNNWEQVNINGKIYFTKLFRRTVLYPQKTGNLIIDPLSLDFSIAYPTGELDFFDDPEYQTTRRVIATPSKSITVKSLPEKGKPDSFTGAVGTFDFYVTVDKNDSKTGEAVQMDLVVVGTGNLKLFEIPKPQLPQDFEVFEPEHREEVRETMKGMSGKISDSYTIIPQKKGNFKLKPQEFSYFDIHTKTYKTISSDAINLMIEQGDKFITQYPNADSNSKSVKAILPIFNETTFSNHSKDAFFSSKWMLFLTGLPLLLALILFLRKDKNEEQIRKKNTSKQVVKSKIKPKNEVVSFEKVENKIGDKDLFYTELNAFLQNYLKRKFNFKSVTTHEELVEKLTELQMEQNDLFEIKSLFEACNMAKYAPVSNFNREQDFEKLKVIVNKIEKIK